MRQGVTSRHCGFESLESRFLLSASPTPVWEKIDDRLNQLSVDLQVGKRNGDAGVVARVDRAKRIQVTVKTIGNPRKVAPQLAALGAKVDYSDKATRVVQAWLPANKLSRAARLSGVARLSYPDYAVVNVTSAGDSILLADKVRSQFAAYGIDGTGIKIGVLSDGANNIAGVGSELPAVTVNPAHPGSGNEGTAMLEIVHDLAPGAQLYFSGVASNTDMTQGISWLVGQGCDVIVDDLGFFGEHYFSDGPIAQAAANAVSQGAVYISASGNYSSNAHWQGQYVQGSSYSAVAGRSGAFHVFSSGDETNDVSIPSTSNGNRAFRVYMQWSDPWGQASNDYDVYLVDAVSGGILASGATTQNGNDQPFESLIYSNTTGATKNAAIKVVKRTAGASRELEFFVFNRTSLQYNVEEDAIFGQQAVTSVMSVAAANATTPDSIAYYSSRGNSTIYTDFAAQTKVVRQTLDGTAIDGVQTRAGQLGYFQANPFFGTSAAAPHAAAIAALVLQAKPALTPAQVSQIMADTATDLTAYGVGYDTSSGAGRYNALDAVFAAFTPPAAPDLTDATDTGISVSDNVTKNNKPTFTGSAPLGSYVRLFSDGVEVAAAQLGSAVSTYSLTPAAAIADGNHLFTVRMSSGVGVALANNSSPSPALAVNIDTTAPLVADAYYNLDNHTLVFQVTEQVSPEPGAGSLTLNNLTTAQSVSVASLNASYSTVTNSAAFRFPGYTGGVLPDGNYFADLSPTLSDAAGNALAAYNGLYFYVLAGDTNMDRSVNFFDLTALSAAYGGAGTWINGDFNADGQINFFDLTALSANYGTTLAPPTE